MNYNKTFVINKDVAATAAGVEMNISFPSSFMIRKMWVVTKLLVLLLRIRSRSKLLVVLSMRFVP